MTSQFPLSALQNMYISLILKSSNAQTPMQIVEKQCQNKNYDIIYMYTVVVYVLKVTKLFCLFFFLKSYFK